MEPDGSAHAPAPAALLPVAEVARRLSVTPRHVQRLILDGHLPAIDVGSGGKPTYRVSPNALRLFIERRQLSRRRWR